MSKLTAKKILDDMKNAIAAVESVPSRIEQIVLDQISDSKILTVLDAETVLSDLYEEHIPGIPTELNRFQIEYIKASLSETKVRIFDSIQASDTYIDTLFDQILDSSVTTEQNKRTTGSSLAFQKEFHRVGLEKELADYLVSTPDKQELGLNKLVSAIRSHPADTSVVMSLFTVFQQVLFKGDNAKYLVGSKLDPAEQRHCEWLLNQYEQVEDEVLEKIKVGNSGLTKHNARVLIYDFLRLGVAVRGKAEMKKGTTYQQLISLRGDFDNMSVDKIVSLNDTQETQYQCNLALDGIGEKLTLRTSYMWTNAD